MQGPVWYVRRQVYFVCFEGVQGHEVVSIDDTESFHGPDVTLPEISFRDTIRRYYTWCLKILHTAEDLITLLFMDT